MIGAGQGTGSTVARLAARLDDPLVAWSLGSFGAIAEFMWSAEEHTVRADSGLLACYTARGGIRIDTSADPIVHDYETPSRLPDKRRHEIALCLPFDACRMARRREVTEIGPDANALREQDRDAILFDMGLAQHNTDVLVRTSDPETLAALRAACGRSLFDPDVVIARDLPRLSPHRVFQSRCARIEVYQPIPSVDGRSPDGPHTHVLPKLLATGRTHAANLPIPAGLVPCLTLHLSRPDPDHATNALQEMTDDTP